MNISITESETFIHIVGYFATALSCSLYIPQLIHLVKSKSANDVSLIFIILNIITTLIWGVYSILIFNIPLLICEIVTIILLITILLIKLYFDRNLSKLQPVENKIINV